MTKKLEDFFNIDSSEEQQVEQLVEQAAEATVEEINKEEQRSILVIKEQLSIAERINEALPQVKGLETEDRDLDSYAEKAMESYDRLMDLGFNVDDRNAGTIFDVANKMLSSAITAKTAKLDKKLKMVQLQLQAAKLASAMAKEEDKEQSDDSNLTTDRNAILNLISQNMKKDK